jgi:hypothetical protein
MFPWTPIMDAAVDDDERDMTANYFHANIPSKSPREALQPLIDKYRGLQYIIKPPRMGFDHELYLEESSYLRPYQGPEDRREESEASERQRGSDDLASNQISVSLVWLECQCCGAGLFPAG